LGTGTSISRSWKTSTEPYRSWTIAFIALSSLRKDGVRFGPMARLKYSALCSLDGYVADADGSFDWAAPDEEVHAVVNDLSRSIGTFLLGRRMYEVLVALRRRCQDFAEI
jgi:hypothetical protein